MFKFKLKNNRFISNFYVSGAIDPWFITGFTDAEGCFSLSILKTKRLKVGWVVNLNFQIELHQNDKSLLEQIQSYFCVGSIYQAGSRQSLTFKVFSVKDLKVVINHFDKFPLLTKKRADYELFKQAYNLIMNKEHLTMEGLRKIVAIKASINRGLSPELKEEFSSVLPLSRSLVENSIILDPHWLVGFISGEGCFLVHIMNSSSHHLGFSVVLRFQITQHSRDIKLMESLINVWDCGSCRQPLNYNHVDFIIQKFYDICNKVVPFFQKYPLIGVKSKDFEDFCKVAELMQNKEHLTAEGLNKIRKIKAGMNKGRCVPQQIRSFSTQRMRENNDSINLSVKNYSITKGKYNWKNYISSNFYSIIDTDVLRVELKAFFDFYKANYPNHEFFAIIFKLQLPNNNIKSCSSTQISRINDEDFEKLFAIFSYIFIVENFLEYVSEDDRSCYNEESDCPTGSIIFSFKPMTTIKQTKYENMYLSRQNMGKKIREGKDFNKDFNYKGFKFPSNMDIQTWPNIIFSPDNKSAIASLNFKNNYRLDFLLNNINDNGYTVNVKYKDAFIFTIIDSKCKESYEGFLYDFKRVITDANGNKKTYLLKDGKVLLYFEKMNVGYIKPVPKQKCASYKPKILTLDFETRDVKTVDPDTGRDIIIKVPICMCIYDGKKSFYFLFKDPKNWIKDLMKAFRNSVMKKKYNGYKIYVHNLSHFDSVFLLDVLSRLGKVKPFYRDKFFEIIFKFKSDAKNKIEYNLTFFDSKLILPASLRDLSKSFGVENKKDFFPYGFVNDENKFSLDYKGPVPKYDDFLNTLTKNEYKEYCNKYKGKTWNLRRELYLYCETDCIALHQILIKYHKQIHDLLHIDITKYPTLPSIAFSGYRANFMKKDQIAKILSKTHYTIKQSYFGGITETYKGKGFNINSYDVNSLYPFAMLNNPMPIGEPTYFSGDISLTNKDPFGFFKVKVSAPLDLNKPTLPFRLETKNGIRTVFPVGTWTCWYFSEEIKDKIKDGYTFEILEGFLFEKSYIFTEYINLLYKIKCNTDSSDSLYYIAKLLMNALYGRFGLNPEARECVIVSHEESEKILAEERNVLTIPLLSGKVLVSYDQNDENINISDISIPISSAIAAYSRIEMSKYIRKYDKNLYYIDTDGIKVDCELDSSEIDSKELGKMKYEFTFKEAVFPGLKVYGGILLKAYKKFLDWMVKVKGLKVDISYYHLNSMNNKYATSVIEQEKWFYQLERSAIIVKSDKYTLTINENKREIIYNSWGDFFDTIPLYLNDGVLEKRNPNSLYYLPAPSSSNQENSKPSLLNQENEKLHDLEKLVYRALHESMMLAGNEAKMLIYKLTGIMHTIDGDMFYYEGKGHESKRVYIKMDGVWLNTSIIIKSGKLTFKCEDWAPSCHSESSS